MPELPEVETIRRSLNKTVVGKRIKDVKVLRKKSFQGSSKKIIEKTIVKISRRAKLLIIELGETDSTIFLVVHLKLTGQILISNFQFPISKSKYTRIVIEFSDGSRLLFNDLRVFGWMRIISKIKDKKLKTPIRQAQGRHIKNKKEQNIKNIDRILGMKFGPEPFDKEFTVDYLKEVFSKTKRAIKIVLMDQEKIAGIGNIYANEILWKAGIHPAKPANELVPAPHFAGVGKIKKLRDSILRVLRNAIKYRGSTAKDDHYKLPDGKKGGYQKHFRVYQRDGKKCKKCGTLIKRSKIGDRGTYFCHRCQK